MSNKTENAGRIEGFDDLGEIAQKQAESIEDELERLVAPIGCSDDEKIRCAIKYGPQAIDNKILITISNTINSMAKSLEKNEDSKSKARETYMSFFRKILVVLLVFTSVMIVAQASGAVEIPAGVFASVIMVIFADIFAIIQSFVKYMNSFEHYEMYNSLINSLLKHLNHSHTNVKDAKKVDWNP